MAAQYRATKTHIHSFSTAVEAVEDHGGLRGRKVSVGERGVVIEVQLDSGRYIVAWPGGRTTTSYPWHITATTEETISYAADLVLFAADATGDLHVLLIKRGWAPFQGHWGFPGGHVNRLEGSLAAAVREAGEETGLPVTAESLTQVGTWDEPGRDPRGRYVTVAYTATLPTMPTPIAGDDACEAHWFRLADAEQLPLAFDHGDILTAALATHSRHIGRNH